MNTRSKLALLTLCAGVTAGAVGVTQAWFVSLNRTPPGSILSALVRYQPEFQEDQTMDVLLTYGNLVGGTGVDEEGVPHVLPGESLLATVLEEGTGADYKRTVHTSRVRSYQRGETVRTVISAETRSYQVVETELVDGEPVEVTKTLEVTRSQRDLFHSEETVTENGILLPPGTMPDLAGWELLTISSQRQDPVTSGGKTVTVITSTSTYVLVGDRTQQKVVVTATTETVTHERETYVGGTKADFDSYLAHGGAWLNTMTETVLALLPDQTNPQSVRTQLTVVGPGRSLPLGNGHFLPLSMGNQSTVATNLRLGVSATLTPRTNEGVTLPTQTLAIQSAGGLYYLGVTDPTTSQFVELLELDLADNWLATTEANVWDLSLPGVGMNIPAQLDPLAEPTIYPAVTGVSVSTSSHFGLADNQEEFELAFNRLYAQNSPLIELRIRFYAKQADYMDWKEFYTTGISMNISGATSIAARTGGAAA